MGAYCQPHLKHDKNGQVDNLNESYTGTKCY